MSTCGAGFTVMSSGPLYDGDHSCQLDRLHEGAHLSKRGFTWGLVNGHDDPWHQKLLEYDRKREETRVRNNKQWYRKLAQRMKT